MTKIKKYIQDPRLFLFIGPLVLLSPVYLTGKALFWGTPSTQFVPWWNFAWQSILVGEFPFWNPLLGMGAPLAANYQTALFYPVTWVYFVVYLFGGIEWMAWSISLGVAGHLIWSGFGTANLLRELDVGKFGQTIGGLAFSLSGYLVARAGFLSINAAAAWLPWLLLFLYRLADREPGTQGKLTAVISMLLLAGHAQTAWYAVTFGGLWLIYWAIEKREDNRGLVNLGRAAAGYLWAGVLAVGISAIQLLPTAEYLILSQRAGEYGYETAMTYSFWPWRFLTFFVPDLFGNPAANSYWGYGNYWEDAVYIGLLPILIGLGFLWKSIAAKRGSGVRDARPPYARLGIFLGAMVLVSFLLALGDNTPIFPFLYHNIPGMNLFQAPTRYTIVAILSLALLAGLGVNRLDKPVGRGLYFTRLAVAGCVAVIAAAVLAGIYLDDIQFSFLYSAGKVGLLGLAAAVLFLAKPGRIAQKKTRTWNFLLISLISLDLLSAGWGLNPGVAKDFYQISDPRDFQNRIWMPDDVEYDLKFGKYFRFDTFTPGFDWQELKQAQLPNLPILRGQAMVNNFDPIVPGYYQEWMDAINLAYPSPQILAMMNVSTIIGIDGDLGINRHSLDQEISPVSVVGCGDIANQGEIQVNDILSSNQNLLENILITAQSEMPCSPGGMGRVEIIEWKNGYLQLELELEQDAWLFWSQTWYPGWTYRVDGNKRVGTFQANYLFQAAPIPSDAQQVEFIYKPASVVWGSLISAFSLIMAAVYVAIRKKKTHP